MHIELPQPDAAARRHSARLTARIAERIRGADGWINFAEFMQLALYEPGLGYYSAGAVKFGEAGDFVTAPEISPLFSRCLAQQLAPLLGDQGAADILEPGAGNGTLAVDVLRELAHVNALPRRSRILEPSAALRAVQAERVAGLPAELAARVEWLDTWPTALRGIVIANEVVDALPVRRFQIGTDGIAEWGVELAGTRLRESVRPADAAFAARVRARLGAPADYPPGYSSELAEQAPAWLASLSEVLEEGLIVLFDYGFSRPEYYLPERTSGTLRCYYRHRAHEDPLFWPGLQDLTAWVDFSALAERAAASGLEVAGYTTQAQFLLAGGIAELVPPLAAAGAAEQAALAGGLRTLLLPGEMGDAVKVLALRRGDCALPAGLGGRDMRSSL
ncbi:MAG: SAM-dependent methyltransferase [Gammaproteobacteria bacterium]|jgi:SAM-dependent MidA family methyltransferase|nr:SAM-dependent methyltransferase [Gammaproteobacteria bacterium]